MLHKKERKERTVVNAHELGPEETTAAHEVRGRIEARHESSDDYVVFFDDEKKLSPALTERAWRAIGHWYASHPSHEYDVAEIPGVMQTGWRIRHTPRLKR